MRKFITLLSITFSLVAFGQSTVEIPSGGRVQIGYPDQEDLAIELRNKSGKALEVATVNKVSGEKISGFGLGPMGKATVAVAELGLLEISNPSSKDVSIGYSITEAKPVIVAKEDVYINFTLRNETMKSIPLIIPGVMNPNLSPKSNSGVSLKIGQEVKYRKGGRTRVLFVVDESISEGDVVMVGELLAQAND
jgi:hypothetical protein